MKKKISIVLVEEHEECNVYSVSVNDGILEYEQFFQKMIQDGKQEDLQKIAYQIGKIGEAGALERYLRAAGKYRDNVWELPAHYIVKSKYRLYCLRYSSAVLLLGNGGLKDTRTYQEDPGLNGFVEMLQQIDRKIQKMISSGEIVIKGKDISGTLEFYI